MTRYSGQERSDPGMSEPRTTPGVLDRMAVDFADHDALVTEERTLTFAELREEVRRAAAALIGLGVASGDRVAIWSPNTWHWVIACLAIQYAGGVMVPLNTRYTAAEASDILARTEAPVLFGMGRFLGADRVADLDRAALPALRHIVGIPIDSDDTNLAGTWDEFLAGPQAPLSEVAARAAAVRPDDPSDVLFTSGTTGRSKGVLCAHRQSLSAPAAWAACGQLTSADRYLCINPFFHNFGYKAGILACLQTGATLIPQLTFDPEQAMRVVAEQRITVLPGPPTIFQTLLDHPARKNYDLSSLRFAVTGAATVPVVLIERMQAELDFDIVLTAYGLTEANGFGTMCRADDDAVTVATTCGRPIADFELRIDCPPGAEGSATSGSETGAGEVLLRGPNVMLGYLDDPEATAAAIDADGWLHTGDVGTVDDAGNLRITDRLKDMYICGGFNVYPAEIEQVLARLDGVADAAVIGVPDERLGEVGRAFIVRRDGSKLDEQAVIDYTKKHLANFKTPRSVVFVATLPRNPGGKVVKPTLREMV
ncbi:3-((3aS,4S,7aS)-7a-methyl-1,5-dioxo-octahydro-1H-inden-4-yl)propanoate--CoA ligase FadD3 [Mycolicibacterium sphagni]